MGEQSVRVSQRKGGALMIRARRLSTAKHEAGHVIPMLVLSLPFKNVEIIPGEITIDTPNMGFVLDRGDQCLGVVRTDAVAWIVGGCQMNVEDRIMQSLAGVAGEQIDWKRPVFGRGDWVGRSLGDMAEAEAYADLLDLVSLKPFFERAWKRLRRYRKAHVALVEALLEKRLLTYDECVAIWEATNV